LHIAFREFCEIKKLLQQNNAIEIFGCIMEEQGAGVKEREIITE